MTRKEVDAFDKYPSGLICDECGDTNIRCFGADFDEDEVRFQCYSCEYVWSEEIDYDAEHAQSVIDDEKRWNTSPYELLFDVDGNALLWCDPFTESEWRDKVEEIAPQLIKNKEYDKIQALFEINPYIAQRLCWQLRFIKEDATLMRIYINMLMIHTDCYSRWIIEKLFFHSDVIEIAELQIAHSKAWLATVGRSRNPVHNQFAEQFLEAYPLFEEYIEPSDLHHLVNMRSYFLLVSSGEANREHWKALVFYSGPYIET